MASEMLQQFDFSQSALGENLFAKHIGHFLDGDALVRLRVDSGTVYTSSLLAGDSLFTFFSPYIENRKRTRQYRRHPGPIPW